MEKISWPLPHILRKHSKDIFKYKVIYLYPSYPYIDFTLHSAEHIAWLSSQHFQVWNSRSALERWRLGSRFLTETAGNAGYMMMPGDTANVYEAYFIIMLVDKSLRIEVLLFSSCISVSEVSIQ